VAYLFAPDSNPDGRGLNTRGNPSGIDINRDHLLAFRVESHLRALDGTQSFVRMSIALTSAFAQLIYQRVAVRVIRSRCSRVQSAARDCQESVQRPSARVTRG
jgi:hypothetical protein